MKEIKKEVKSYTIAYLSEDGNEFNSREECEKYEKTALGVLNTEYKKLVVKSVSETEFTGGFGCEDNTIEIVKINNEKEARVVKQLCLLINPEYNSNSFTDTKKKTFDLIDSVVGKDDCLPIYRSYDDESFWIPNTVRGISNTILSHL